jgi:8-oxo-dGTP pyrophosphatase MutT (NUDIX family)
VIQSIADFCPPGAESGVGLALRDEQGRYVFFLAGPRHYCPPGELFYAGIGGHREPGEDWLDCAQREALEEIGTEVEILSAPDTWYIPEKASARQVEVSDRPRPLALYEMIHPPGTPRAGEVYRIVVYQAILHSLPTHLLEDEVLAVITLSRDQVVRGLDRKPALSELLGEGARIMASTKPIDGRIRLYPLGTGRALAHVLRHMPTQPASGAAEREGGAD